ncbi:MAG TPA: hypothetical protein VFM55_08805 [Micromonosporaceae bacterium]|nr:hypothetical protein [Micromonosporaceae bacterium]
MADEPTAAGRPDGDPADETTPRDSAPVTDDFQGPVDPDAEQFLLALMGTGTSTPEGAQQ